MPKEKLRLGIGATCSVALKYLHPRKVICDKYTNTTARQTLDGLISLKKETLTVNRREQECVVFRHEEFEGILLHCVLRWVKITSEGSADTFFDDDGECPEAEVVLNGDVDRGRDLPDTILALVGRTSRREDIQNVRAMGFNVDDDNEPAPENVPTPGETVETSDEGFYDGQVWGWAGFCNRKREGGRREKAKVDGYTNELLCGMSMVQVFLLMFPKDWFENIMLVETQKMTGLSDLTFGELLTFLGIWLLLATTVRMDRKKFWSLKAIDRASGAPFRLNDIMSNRRFDQILQGLQFTALEPPSYKDRFWEVREMIAEWNENMASSFTSSWVSCLDESISIWFNKWTCPGWMFVPRKPHPFGNEYHSVCCGETGIMWGIELVEGKDAQKVPQRRGGDKMGKTTLLLLRILKPIFGTAKVIILDSGFCVLKALVELRKKGLYSSAVIKKRRYWPSLIPGDKIDAKFKELDVGATESLRGELDGIKYDVFCLKEPQYVMKLMSTYAGLVDPFQRYEVNRHYVHEEKEIKSSFNLQEPFANHYLYRHAVDDHNNVQHSLPSIEDTWGTHRWPARVFSFLFAISEVNTWLIFRHFIWEKDDMDLVSFRKKLAFALIENEYLKKGENAKIKKKRKLQGEHTLVRAPPHCGKVVGGMWKKNCKQPYQNYPCKTPKCKNRVRTTCSCSLGIWMCGHCHTMHVINTIEEGFE